MDLKPIPLSHRRTRRDALAQALRTHPLAQASGGDVAAVLFSTPTAIRNDDVEHRYRADADLGWLTGFSEPDCALVVRVGPSSSTTAIFVRPRDREREIWTGRRLGPERAVETLGVDEAFSIEKLSTELARLLWGCSVVFTHLGRRGADDGKVVRALSLARSRTRRVGCAPEAVVDLTPVLGELRWQKDAYEIDRMRAAARAAVAGHRAAMARCRPGVTEADLEAELAYTFHQHGGHGHAYNPIVAAGDNACILHYDENEDTIEDGELVLIDAGAEVDLYAADITRTFPANGKMSGPQRELYDIVLTANHEGIKTAAPGATMRQIDDAARRVLAEGLIGLGLLAGSVDEVVERKPKEDDPPWAPGKSLLERFYMHGTGHYLGLDVHDAGRYHDGGDPRKLVPGVVLTVEPGIYVSPDDEEAPEQYRGIGIRIEDDVLITDGGNEVLTADLAKEVADVEAAVGE